MVLASGGKDSLYAAYVMHCQGWMLRGLVSVEPSDPYSYMFHSINLSAVKFQADAMNVRLYPIKVETGKESEVNEFEVLLGEVLSKTGVNSVVTGAVHSEYQRARFDRVFSNLNAHCFSPLWQKNELVVLDECSNAGFKFMLSGVYAMGLDASWVGRELGDPDFERLKKLSTKFGFSAIGEGGEYESLVLDCPLFRKRLEVTGTTEKTGDSYEFVLKTVSLVPKR